MNHQLISTIHLSLFLGVFLVTSISNLSAQEDVTLEFSSVNIVDADTPPQPPQPPQLPQLPVEPVSLAPDNYSCTDLSCGCADSTCYDGCAGNCHWLRGVFNGDSWLGIDAAYRGEVFNNTRGGIRTNDATRYTGRLDILFSADLDRFCLSPGGLFVVHFQNLNGEGITDDIVGAQQRLSTIDGNPGAGYNLTQVSQYYWQRGFFDDSITIKLGKILADSEFVLNTLGGDFINTSFGWTHTLPLAAYPNPSAGVVGNFQLTDALSFKTGFFDGAGNGRNWGFSGTGDVLSLFEFRRQHTLCCDYQGDIHFGGWHHNGDFTNQAGGADFSGNHGFYAGMTQQLTRECTCCPDDIQGLGAFVHYGWTPDDRNRVGQYWGAGLVYRGLFCGRDADTTGIGIGNMNFSDDIPTAIDDETVIELFYKARIGERLVLQPDVQYFSNPGGVYSDSLAIGLRFELTL